MEKQERRNAMDVDEFNTLIKFMMQLRFRLEKLVEEYKMREKLFKEQVCIDKRKEKEPEPLSTRKKLSLPLIKTQKNNETDLVMDEQTHNFIQSYLTKFSKENIRTTIASMLQQGSKTERSDSKEKMYYVQKLFRKVKDKHVKEYTYKYSVSYLRDVIKAIKVGINEGTTVLRSKLNPLLDNVEDEFHRVVEKTKKKFLLKPVGSEDKGKLREFKSRMKMSKKKGLL